MFALLCLFADEIARRHSQNRTRNNIVVTEMGTESDSHSSGYLREGKNGEILRTQKKEKKITLCHTCFSPFSAQVLFFLSPFIIEKEIQ